MDKLSDIPTLEHAWVLGYSFRPPQENINPVYIK